MLAISLDIETYGITEAYSDGRPSAPQRYWNPARMLAQDKVPLSELISTVSITTIAGIKADRWLIEDFVPRETRVFDARLDANYILEWLNRADLILGHNIAFDIRCLRATSPTLYRILDANRILIDTGILNYLQCEQRDERSLKDLGEIFGIFTYKGEDTARNHRFPHPHDSNLRLYNARDSHRTVLLAAALAKWITKADGPHTLKLSDTIINHYSDLLWSLIEIGENGVPLSRSKLLAVEEAAREEIATNERILAQSGLVLTGKGSQKSRDSYIRNVYSAINNQPKTLESLHLENIYDMRALKRTSKGNLSTDELNRTVAEILLSPHDENQKGIAAWNALTEANGTLSKYTYPLLRGARSNPEIDTQIAIGSYRGGDVGIAYSDWFAVPSNVKDTSPIGGGQKQARPSAKNPACQTFPPTIKKCEKSRFNDGWLISLDLSQIELRVPGVLSGEPTLVLEYNTPKPDLHTKRAITVFGPEVLDLPGFKSGDMRVDPRQWGKTLNFSDLYWAGALKLQQILLLRAKRLFPIGFFQEIVANRPILRPVLYAWQQQLIDRARRDNKLSLDLIGLSRLFSIQGDETFDEFGNHKDDTNEALNFPVQTWAAFIMLQVQITFHRRLRATKARKYVLPYKQVYDAIALDVHPVYREQAHELLKASVKEVEAEGWWARLTDHTGHWLPLGYEINERQT